MEAVKESVRAYWEKQAHGFDLEFGHGLRDQRHKEIWLSILQRNIPSDQPLKILDLGCGTGFLSILLSELGHEVSGLDFSPAMLDIARGKARDRGLTIDFSKGDAEEPGFSPRSFDYVICRHLIWTLPHPDLALKRWRALLRPGGGVILVEGHWKSTSWRAGVRRFLGDLVQIVEQGKKPEAWEKSYVQNIGDLPLFGGRPSGVLRRLLEDTDFSHTWTDGLEDLLENEYSQAPLSYRLRYGRSRERRFLLGARI